MKRLIELLQGPMADTDFRELVADATAALIGAVWLVLMLVMFGESWFT